MDLTAAVLRSERTIPDANEEWLIRNIIIINDKLIILETETGKDHQWKSRFMTCHENNMNR